jgi:apolipoprotein N-acyltransferase
MILNLLLALASGLLMSLALPPMNQAWLSVIALTPFLFGSLVRKRSLLLALWNGFFFGAAFGGFAFAWLTEEGRWTDWFANSGSLAGLGMTWSWFLWRFVELPVSGPSAPKKANGLKPLFVGSFGQQPAWNTSLGNLRIAAAVASSWTFLEWARGVLMPSWNGFGLPLTENVALLQSVRTTGVLGLTFVVVFCNVIVLCTVRRLILEPGRMSWASRFDFTATLAAVFVIALGGVFALGGNTGREQRSVACVQPGNSSVDSHIEMSRPVLDRDLIVWNRVVFAKNDYSRLKEASIGDNIGLVAGVANSSDRPIAGCIVVIPGAIKNVVIPRLHGPIFRPIFAQPPSRLDSFAYKDAIWLPLLNWEAGSPRTLRAAVQNQVQIFVVLFDPSFRSKTGALQLQQNLRAWSVGLGRPLVFSSSLTSSFILESNGLVAQATNDKSLLEGGIGVPPASPNTLYARGADWLPIFCGLFCIVFGLMERLRRPYVPAGRVAS